LTGITYIDDHMQGLAKGAVTVLSGLRGAGKSTIIGQIILNAVNKGHIVSVFSGELSLRNFFDWIFVQAAGPEDVQCINKYSQNYKVTDPATKEKIRKWLHGKLSVFNHERYSNDFNRLYAALEQKISTEKTDLVIIDNLMSLNLTIRSDKNDAQTEFVWKLKRLARAYNVHVIFVAHPRKASGFLRLDDISGTGNIGNIVDTAMILHRANVDFYNAAAAYYKKDLYKIIPQPAPTSPYSNIVEICKDREFGNQDKFIPLWFEQKTKRLKNSEKERMVFGWRGDFDDVSAVDDENPY